MNIEIPQIIGPWRHALFVIEEAGLSHYTLMQLLEDNQIAFVKPKWLHESQIYLHRDWVDAVKSNYPIARYCLLQRHLLMNEFSEEEWRRRVPHRKPKELASEKQIATLRKILKSDFILEGERKWILPLFDEKWIGYYRIRHILEYFLGYKLKDSKNRWIQINEGVFELRRKSLALFYETPKKAELVNDDWF